MLVTSELDSRMQALRCCILIPTYNNAPFLPALLTDLKVITKSVVVVNDGSTDGSGEILLPFSDDFDVVHHSENKGKGMALRTGFQRASELGYRYAITIDSDGQHLLEDLDVFIETLENNPGCAIVGARNMDQDGVPKKSNFGNRFSNFWYYVETFIKLPDTQSGYRLYPLEPIQQMTFYTRKFEFEIEILVRLAWRGVTVLAIPVSVIYHDDGTRITHFRPLKDFTRISILNSVLVLVAFLYVHPRNFVRALNWTNIKGFLDRHLFNSEASNAKLAVEVGFGFFMGIVPIWGYQMLVAIFMSHLLRLNKVVVLLAANISVPPLIPFIIYGSYLLGGYFVDTDGPPLTLDTELTFETVGGHLLQYGVGAVALAILTGVVGGLFFYLLFVLFRKETVK